MRGRRKALSGGAGLGAVVLLLLPVAAGATWSPGMYAGVGASQDCISFDMTRTGMKALRAGGCDWRFECGANGGRGAPIVGWKRVAVDRGGRFSAHHDPGFFAAARVRPNL